MDYNRELQKIKEDEKNLFLRANKDGLIYDKTTNTFNKKEEDIYIIHIAINTLGGGERLGNFELYDKVFKVDKNFALQSSKINNLEDFMNKVLFVKEWELIDSNIKIKKKEIKQYELSPHLREYQNKIVNTALNNDSYAIFSDTGTGKTIDGLEIANQYNKILVICPLSIIETAWIEDCESFYPNKKIISLWDKSKSKRIELLNQKADIYVINYEGLKLITNEILDKHLIVLS